MTTICCCMIMLLCGEDSILRIVVGQLIEQALSSCNAVSCLELIKGKHGYSLLENESLVL